jgi:hypothetical protein
VSGFDKGGLTAIAREIPGEDDEVETCALVLCADVSEGRGEDRNDNDFQDFRKSGRKVRLGFPMRFSRPLWSFCGPDPGRMPSSTCVCRASAHGRRYLVEKVA